MNKPRIVIAILLSFIGYSINLTAQNSVTFNGTNSYITFGNNSKLGLAQFTLECWFKRTGTGATTSTGTGGVTAVPLISKGRGESDGSNLDCNYFLGIQATTNYLCADFEEGSAGTTPGLNHPIVGVTAIQNNIWYHCAVTYTGNVWNLYLNGKLESTVTVNQPTQNLSIQHSAIATALTSTGVVQGYFMGQIDEVRIWNSAKSLSEIVTNINKKISVPTTGLVAGWGLNEGTGTVINDISGNACTGTLVGGYTWTTNEAPYNLNIAPIVNLIYPLNNENCIADSVKIQFNVTDIENDTVRFKLYRRLKKQGAPDFTFVPLPDVQFLTQEANGGKNSMFKTQTKWIVDNKSKLNIVHVCQLGDCVQNGDNNGNDIEWKRADTSMKIIEDSITTKLKDGIPFTMVVGNHDQGPTGNGDPKGTTTFFNQYFGVNRFLGRNYWGGNYGSNNDNNYQLFTASGIDFLTISMEYDVAADSNVLNWANNLLKAHPNRKAIIIAHWIINSDGSFGAQGQAIYNKLKGNANLFMMLCGHINPNGEARRSDVFNGNTVHTLLSDYQDRANGGNAWLRIMKFSPTNNSLSVQTYSPTLNQFETDANSQFTITGLKLAPENPFTLMDSFIIANGNGTIARNWKNLVNDTLYDWYYEFKDKANSFQSGNLSFYTRKPLLELGNDISSCDAINLVSNLNNVNYLWSNGETDNAIVVGKTERVVLTVNAKNTTCFVKDSVKITILEKPLHTLGKDTVICSKSITLTAALPNMNYLWNTGATTRSIEADKTEAFILKITNPINNCFSFDTVRVTLAPNLPVELGENITQCGGKVTIKSNINDATYLWNTNERTNEISVDRTGNYILKVTDKNNCFGTDSISVIIKNVPATPAIIGQSEYCEQDKAVTIKSTGENVVWYRDYALKIELQKGNSLFLGNNFEGTFYSQQTQNDCKSAAGSITIKKYTLPAISILGLQSQYWNTDNPVVLTATPAGGIFTGKGVFSNVFYPRQLDSGNTLITYSYISSAGCVGTTAQTVSVKYNPFTGISKIDSTHFVVYPNPFTNEILIKLNFNSSNPITANLVDVNGKIVFSEAEINAKDLMILEIPNTISPGLYQLILMNNDFKIAKKVLKN